MLNPIYRLWSMIPGNPLVLRVLSSCSRLPLHFWIRMIYMGVLLSMVGWGLLVVAFKGNSVAALELAKMGESLLGNVAFLQVLLVCLISPVFMAGAISEEQAGKTWSILLTTPMSGFRIVIGSLCGRLSLVWALLLSSLPFFALIQVFGGIRTEAVYASFWVAALASLFMGSFAVGLSVFRLGGRKVVFGFVTSVVSLLLLLWGLDRFLLWDGSHTTWLTPFHPILLIDSQLKVDYHAWAEIELQGRGVLAQWLLGRPLASFTVLATVSSFLILFLSSFAVRGWIYFDNFWMALRTRMGLSGGQLKAHPMRGDGNPVAWLESSGRSRQALAFVGRIGFVIMSAGVTLAMLWFYHVNQSDHSSCQLFQSMLAVFLVIQVLVAFMVAVYISGGSVSREREDGTLDILLTTPITPKVYIWGKLQGLVRFLLLLASGPILSLFLVALYAQYARLVGWSSGSIEPGYATSGDSVPLIPLEVPFLLAMQILALSGVAVALGMYWSLRTRTVTGAIVPTLLLLGGLLSVVGGCGFFAGINDDLAVVGPFLAGLTPITALLAVTHPEQFMKYIHEGELASRISFGFGVLFSVGLGVFGIVLICRTIVTTFSQTVRRLSGQA